MSDEKENEKREGKRDSEGKRDRLLDPFLVTYYTICSGTSDNGHSEERTTSLQWAHCSPPTYIFSIHFYLRRRDNL